MDIQLTDSHMDVTGFHNIRSDGCNNNIDRMSSGYELISLRGESNKHLSSVVINKINYVPISNSLFLVLNSILNIDFSYFQGPAYTIYSTMFYIYRQFNLRSSKFKCKCDCKCNTPCTGNTICLCLCDLTRVGASGCCICICKHKNCNSKCKCVCICICKNGDSCATEHQCNQCLVKVDIATLKDQTSTILCYLRWITCHLSLNCYKSIISRIHWIELLFKEIGTRISELRTLKDILSLLSSICTKCAQCSEGCFKDINILVENIQKALKYYSLFRSRIKEIRSFVEYKINYSKSKDIISSLEKSINPQLKQLSEINTQLLISADYAKNSNRLSVVVYSHYCIFQCFLALYILLQCSSKLSISLYINQIVENCKCVNFFNSNGTKFQTTDFWEYISGKEKNNRDELKKLFIPNDGNHTCLCLVIKYALYPNLIKSLVYLRFVYLDVLSKLTREFEPSHQIFMNIKDKIKMLFIIMNLIYKISMFMERRYLWTTTEVKVNPDLLCLCRAPEDIYYPYLISIILFLSSLLENIWTMDSECTSAAIGCLSCLISEFEMIDSSTSLKSVCCNPVYTLLVKKECKSKEKDGKCCCCWCVTSINIIVICISLCLQFKIHKAIGGKEKCEQWNKYFDVQECECQCTKENNKVCCLVQLALSSPLSKGCQDLSELLKDCSKECKEGKNGCCKTLEKKLKEGNCKVLLLGCNCDCTSGAGTTAQVKVKWVLFNYPGGLNSVAVLVFCKCAQPSKCCLTELIEKLKKKLENLCQGDDCKCQELKTLCTEICGEGCPQCEKDCVCKTLQGKLPEICNGSKKNCGNGKCLCQLITETFKICNEGTCKCKNKEGGCCRCVCCKLLGMSLRILVRACRANVLDPYKRIAIDLLSSSKDNAQLIKSIVYRINNGTLNRIYLIKNNLLTSSSYGTGLDTNISVESRNWGYDTRYEHEIICNNSYSDV